MERAGAVDESRLCGLGFHSTSSPRNSLRFCVSESNNGRVVRGCRVSDISQWLEGRVGRFAGAQDGILWLSSACQCGGWSPCKSNPAGPWPVPGPPGQACPVGHPPHSTPLPHIREMSTDENVHRALICAPSIHPIYSSSFAQRRQPGSTSADFPLLTTSPLHHGLFVPFNLLIPPPTPASLATPPVARSLEAITGPGRAWQTDLLSNPLSL